jgi:hypothetical protein
LIRRSACEIHLHLEAGRHELDRKKPTRKSALEAREAEVKEGKVDGEKSIVEMLNFQGNAIRITYARQTHHQRQRNQVHA